MRADIVVKGDSISGIFGAIKKAIEKECRTTATKMSKEQRKNISQRTLRGEGLDGPMPALTNPYQRAKRKQGKRTIRNLRLSGEMIGDMQANRSQKQGSAWIATIDFKTGRSAQIAAYNQRRSPWFGFSDGDTDRLVQWAESNFFKNLLKRLK